MFYSLGPPPSSLPRHTSLHFILTQHCELWIIFSIYWAQLVLPVCWHPLEHVWLIRGESLKKETQISLSAASSHQELLAKRGTWCHCLSPCWDLFWLELTQALCMPSQSLLIRLCNFPVAPRHTWFLPVFLLITAGWGGLATFYSLYLPLPRIKAICYFFLVFNTSLSSDLKGAGHKICWTTVWK